MDIHSEKTIGKYKIEIIYDTDPIDPRGNDNLGTMVCFSKRYSWGDKHDFPDPDQFAIFVVLNREKIITLPLYVYVHSGTTMNTTGFSCPWDSWCCGRIYVTKEKVRKEYGWKRLSKKRIEQIEGYLKSEVEEYDQYLTGDCYGYRITDTDTQEEIDSCWGFYGDEYCMTEATGIVEHIIEKDKHGQLELEMKE